MNFDANTLSMLMQLLNSKQSSQNGETSASNDSKTVSTHNDDKHVKNAFYAQNGIGEVVNISQNSPKPSSDIFDNGQSPLMSMLKTLGGGKNDMSSMLPVMMSLLQKSPQKNLKTDSDVKCAENKPVENGENKKAQDKTCDQREKDKTQRDPFAPVAFAGYEVLSILAALLTSTRRLYK